MSLIGGSSASTTAFDGTAGSQTQSGDPLSIQISTNRSNNDVSVHQNVVNNYVDAGLVETAENITREGFRAVETGLYAALEVGAVAERIAEASVRSGESVARDVLDFSEDSISGVLDSNRETLAFTEDALRIQRDTSADAFLFAEGILDQQADTFSRALGAVEGVVGDAFAGIVGFGRDAVSQSNAALAEVNRDGSERTAQILLGAGAAVAIVLVLAARR